MNYSRWLRFAQRENKCHPRRHHDGRAGPEAVGLPIASAQPVAVWCFCGKERQLAIRWFVRFAFFLLLGPANIYLHTIGGNYAVDLLSKSFFHTCCLAFLVWWSLLQNVSIGWGVAEFDFCACFISVQVHNMHCASNFPTKQSIPLFQAKLCEEWRCRAFCWNRKPRRPVGSVCVWSSDSRRIIGILIRACGWSRYRSTDEGTFITTTQEIFVEQGGIQEWDFIKRNLNKGNHEKKHHTHTLVVTPTSASFSNGRHSF